MADPREVFPILDNQSGEGSVPGEFNEGDNYAGATNGNGLVAFAYKDSSGAVVLPSLNDEGAVVVSFDAGTTLRANGELAAGSLSIVDITGATLALTLGDKYSKANALVSCRRAALLQIVHEDDVGGVPTETVLLEGIVGPGQFTIPLALLIDLLDTTGGTGVQALKVKGKNFTKLSSMRAAISCNELPS